jgi:hypothetical protein
MIETQRSPEGSGDTMNQRSFLLTSFSIGMLLAPVLVAAQQRGPAAPGMQMPMVAPSHAMVMMAPAAAVHGSAHINSAQAIHPGAHSSAGVHVVSGKNVSHGSSPKVAVHGHLVRPSGGLTTSGATNGRFAPQAAVINDGYAVPGLGFDYAHFAAVHPQAIHHHFAGGGIVPFVGGGIYLPMGGGYYVDGAAPQESSEETQEADVAEPVDSAGVAPAEQAPVSPRARTKPYPVPAASPEYIFVRRDGTVFFAVAYSWQNGTLQYVTQDGFRKLVSQSTLDLDATTQFNEQRGLVFRSPA